MPAITTTLLSTESLKAEVGRVAAIPNPKPPTTTSSYWMQVIIRNATQFPIIPRREFFDSGSMTSEYPPQVTGMFSVSQFVTQSELAGSTGGASFSLVMDPTCVIQPMSVGFCDPLVGQYKGCILLNDKPEDAYEAATEYGTYLVSSAQYTGKDKEGAPIACVLDCSATVMKNGVIINIIQKNQ